MIGVFDSGFGGLSVLKGLTSKFPEYDYLYLGDTARVPYGNRSPETIYQFTCQCVDYLMREGCQLVILACNTATSVALKKLQEEYLPESFPTRKILGVIKPLAEKSVEEKKKNKRIGLLATRATVNSGAYDREILKLDPEAKIISQPAPLLVPMIEEGFHKTAVFKKVLRTYLRILKNSGVNVLIPGCTHYGLIEKTLQEIMGKSCVVLEVGKVVADSLEIYLKKHSDLEKSISKKGKIEFLTTDNAKLFDQLGERFWGKKFSSKKVSV